MDPKGLERASLNAAAGGGGMAPMRLPPNRKVPPRSCAACRTRICSAGGLLGKVPVYDQDVDSEGSAGGKGKLGDGGAGRASPEICPLGTRTHRPSSYPSGGRLFLLKASMRSAPASPPNLYAES